MNNQIIIAAIVVLLGGAFALGYLALQSTDQSSDPEEFVEREEEQESGFSYTDESVPVRDRVLQAPGPDASEDDRIAHFQLASDIIEDSDTLTITANCVLEPLVLRMKIDDPVITVHNADEVTRTLAFPGQDVRQFPAGAIEEVELDFSEGVGLYGYGCDTVPRAAGFFFVEA